MSKKITLAAIVFVSLILASAFLIVGDVNAQAALNGAMGSSQSSSASSGYKMTVSYQILGIDLPSSGPKLTYVDINLQTHTIPLTSFANTITMAKKQPWSVTPPVSNLPSERWYSTNTLSGTTPNSGSTSQVFKFQHQFYLTVISAHDSASGSGWFNSGTKAYTLNSPKAQYREQLAHGTFSLHGAEMESQEQI